VLYRRYRGPRGGEVDLVCRDGDTLVFVEVKTRASVVFGWPVEAVNAPKQRLIARGALAWLRLLDDPAIPFRFDVVEVVIEEGRQPRLNWIREAFTLPAPYIY
jgi:putative endonuclease